jgi:hypothetical protein
MDKEYYENTETYSTGDIPMRLPTQTVMSTSDFQNHLISAKTLKGKLAVCLKKLSESGCFSDQDIKVWEFRQEISEHLPEELRSG